MTKKYKCKKYKYKTARIPNKSIVENANNSSNNTPPPSSNNSLNNNQFINLGLDKFSYADYIILTSLAAYAIAEDLNDSDLDLTILFFSILSSDLALLRTQRGILQKQQAQKKLGNIATDSTDNSSSNGLIADLSRNVKVKKKYIKRKKVYK